MVIVQRVAKIVCIYIIVCTVIAIVMMMMTTTNLPCLSVYLIPHFIYLICFIRSRSCSPNTWQFELGK